MTLKFALAGLAAIAGLAAAAPASAAMPIGLPDGVSQSGNVENVRWVCDVYGRCYNRPDFYYGPRYYGGYGYGPPRPRFYGGYGYGPRFYGGGYRRW